jgi:hypothetical protein
MMSRRRGIGLTTKLNHEIGARVGEGIPKAPDRTTVSMSGKLLAMNPSKFSFGSFEWRSDRT